MNAVMRCRFFSRCPGWNVDDPPSAMRHYWSPAVDVPEPLQRSWCGWSGLRVVEAVEQCGEATASLKHLGHIALQDPDWFLYPENTCMGCGPEHYV